MSRSLARTAGTCVLAVAGFYAWTHRSRLAAMVAAPQAPVAAVNTESSQAQQAKGAVNTEPSAEQQARGMVTITGPLADYMMHRAPSPKPQNADPASSCSLPSCKPTEMDMVVGDSPVGTSTPILRKTFEVAALVNLPFDVPPHSASPQLHGKYRSFSPKGRLLVDEDSADVEFLLLNRQQYDLLLHGRSSDVVFSAPDSHNQEVNASMSPTFAEPGRYYLVFRNNSRASGKKLVQADFWMEF